MSCLLTAGVTRDCGHSFGGLKELYIGNFAEISQLNYNVTTGQVTGATMTSTGATAYAFEFVPETAQILEELVKAGASSSINQTLNFQLNGITLAKKKILDTLSLATCYVVVKKSDNSYWIYGEPTMSAGLKATVLTIDSGTAQADSAGATITLVGAALNYAPTVTTTAFAILT